MSRKSTPPIDLEMLAYELNEVLADDYGLDVSDGAVRAALPAFLVVLGVPAVKVDP